MRNKVLIERKRENTGIEILMACTGTIFSKIERKKTTYPSFSCIINNAPSLQGSLEGPPPSLPHPKKKSIERKINVKRNNKS
ncbi:hypothetical protein WN48_10360 [Eufriesea mexicana]|nr:hypothetical protein WN48_10360 [Eufriesea mexicana]